MQVSPHSNVQFAGRKTNGLIVGAVTAGLAALSGGGTAAAAEPAAQGLAASQQSAASNPCYDAGGRYSSECRWQKAERACSKSDNSYSSSFWEKLSCMFRSYAGQSRPFDRKLL